MKKVLSVILIFVCCACSDVKKSEAPENLFSKQKMAEVLTDLYIVEAAISSNRESFLKTGVLPSSYLYEKHDMDSISFQENLNYWTDRVEDYSAIIDSVQSNLESLQDSVSNRQERINIDQQKMNPSNNQKDTDSIERKLSLLPQNELEMEEEQ